MNFFCVACLTRGKLHPEFSLCDRCETKLSKLQTTEARRHGAVYEYRDLARDLILRVKIGGDHAALATLKVMAASNFPDIGSQDMQIRLMPAASSLWGRLRGRFDLADALTRAIAEKCGLSVQKAPDELYWRIQKSSLQSRTRRLNALPSNDVPTVWDNLKVEPIRAAVLIDDIRTTGATYHRHAEVLSRTCPEIHLYMWALAWTPSNGSS